MSESQTPPEADEKPEEPKRPEWAYKREFGINTKMREVILQTKSVAEAELAGLRQKLERLTYGG